MNKTILVTGGAGYIGSACVAALVEAGHAVTVFDDLSTGQVDKVSPRAQFIEGDITNQAAIRAAVQSAPFDAVMHFAAKKAVGESEENPALYFHTNVVGSYYLLAALAEAGIPQIIFSSTAVVYDTPAPGERLSEHTPTNPRNVYGTSKLMVEDMIRTFARTGTLSQYTILRYFNVAGDAGLRFLEANVPNVFPMLAKAAAEQVPFSIFGSDYDTSDGTCVRDYIHLRDLVDAHLRALSAPSGTYNLGTGTGYSVRELVNAFAAAGASLDVVETGRRPGDPALLVADSSYAQAALKWQPTHTLADMVESTLELYGLKKG